ncbi:MAG: hypothetical protein SH868_18575 [Bythopirellula sp.]|nr:hypothetical protein [Bythopirellula sp.]
MDKSIKHLRSIDCCGYRADGAWAAEPTTLACLALATHGEHTAAERLAQQLADVQQSNGAVTANSESDSPAWTTSLAILAWLACEGYQGNIDRAVEWTLATHGKPAPRNPQIGHDPTILGWSWAAETHAWMEPTCMFVIALKAAGLGDHARTREGVRLVTDRLLPTGGSNFGSTLVLGQPTLPQVQSTGLAMLALAGETNSDPRVESSLRYLAENLIPTTTTASLSYGLLGLTAHNRRPPHAEALLAGAWEREVDRGQSAYKLALLALASVPNTSWLPSRTEIHA